MSIEKMIAKEYKRYKPMDTEIDTFKKALKRLLININPKEHEENMKGHMKSFLQSFFNNERYLINTKNNIDLVIHKGENSESPVSVLIETKRPYSKEMEYENEPTFMVKGIYELLLYFYEEFDLKNVDMYHLILSDGYIWYIFDAGVFKKLFIDEKSRYDVYKSYKKNKSIGNASTEDFYTLYAPKIVQSAAGVMDFLRIDLRLYLDDCDQDGYSEKIVDLYKVLSPINLLRESIVNDTNTLDSGFYNELLYILGLKERRDKTAGVVIERFPEGERNDGALIENLINQIESTGKTIYITDYESYGNTNEERLYSVALELCITWLNRVLFLKLLEGRLIQYEGEKSDYSFLNAETIRSYDDLDSLFFKVLAVPKNERKIESLKKYSNLPYLNSSLFEITTLERELYQISQLDDECMPIYSKTILKDKGYKVGYKKNTLHYLLEFLGAYDFSGNDFFVTTKTSKVSINASVLGLLFEKINGYKDGSFFTPGYITMHICEDVIQRTVIKKFNEVLPENRTPVKTLKDIRNYIGLFWSFEEANEVVDSIRICDPAVGSGHFLVSALNELISIKSKIGILLDEHGNRLLSCIVEYDNDELRLLNADKTPFVYNFRDANSQIVQKTIFNEKRKLIENCLFGVDINPKSVSICRLRLWIELLKNAYYAEETNELVVLPNIDINIQTGNSVLFRYNPENTMMTGSSALATKQYQKAVRDYRGESSKFKKREINTIITKIVMDADIKFSKIDKWTKTVEELTHEYNALKRQSYLFEPTKEMLKKKEKKLTEYDKQIKDLLKKIKSFKEASNMHKAFEWRFRFSDVLDSEGNYVGFDCVIGNPPYIGAKGNSDLFDAIRLGALGQYHSGRGELFYYFIHLAILIAKSGGYISFITTDYYTTASYGKLLRAHMKKSTTILSLVDFNELKIFESAKGQHNMITTLLKGECAVDSKNILVNRSGNATYEIFNNVMSGKDLDSEYFKVNQKNIYDGDELYIRIKGISSDDDFSNVILEKMASPIKLGSICNVNQGMRTGIDKTSTQHKKKYGYLGDVGNGVFILNREEIVKKQIDLDNDGILKKFYKNSDIGSYYSASETDRYVIYVSKNMKEVDFQKKYPDIYGHLKDYKDLIVRIRDNNSEDVTKWFTPDRPRDEKIFISPKIVVPQRSKSNTFGYNEAKWYSSADVYYITTKNPEYDLKYILGLLNSKLFYLWLYNRGKRKGQQLELYDDPLGKIPIREKCLEFQNRIVEKVNEILSKVSKTNERNIAKGDSIIRERMNEIDAIIYAQYSLSEKEIEYVEAFFTSHVTQTKIGNDN